MWLFGNKKSDIENACDTDSFLELAKAINNNRNNYQEAVKTLKANGNLGLLLKIQTLKVAGDDLMHTLLDLDERDPKVREAINRVGKDGFAPIHLFSTLPTQSICIRALANNGADLDVKDSENRTPLLLAIEQGLIDNVQMLLNNGANDVDSPDQTGWTPLHYACQLAKPQIVAWLLQTGAKVNPISRDGFMPIHVAISTMMASRQMPTSPIGRPWDQQDALNCISLLVANGADINYRCARGFAAKDVLTFRRQ